MERVQAESFPPQERIASQKEVVAWFTSYFDEQYRLFQDQADGFSLDDQRSLELSFEEADTSPIGRMAKYTDVKNGALNGLLEWIRRARLHENTVDLQAFLGVLSDDWLRWTPNIFEASSSILATAVGEILANDDLAEHFSKLIGAVNYDLSFDCRSTAELFLRSLQSASQSDQRYLLTLLSLPTLMNDARNWSYSEHTAGAMLPEAIRQWGQNPERSILQRLVSQKIMSKADNEPDARVNDEQPTCLVRTENPALVSSARRIARDTIGAISHGYLQELATIPINQAEHASPKSQPIIEQLQRIEPLLNKRWHTHGETIDLYAGARFLAKTQNQPLSVNLDEIARLAEHIRRLQKEFPLAPTEKKNLLSRQFEEAIEEWNRFSIQASAQKRELVDSITKLTQEARLTHPIPELKTLPVAKALFQDDEGTAIAQAETLKVLHHPATRAVIEERLGFPLVELSLREQLRFGEWLLSTNEARGAATLEVVRRFGPNAARTFLALETDAAHGERILAFANNADPVVAKQVFETFARIADTVDLSAQELANQLYKDDGQTVDAERVRNELVKRGSRILLDTESALTEDPSGVGILDELQRYEADTILFTSLFSSAFKGKEASFEALRDLETQTCELADLSPDDRARMKQLLDQEWSKKPLEFLFPDTGTFRFFILRRRGRIEGFMRFEDQSNTSRHANFLCVDHSLRGSGVGENVLREAIARAGRNVTLHAEFDAAIPAGSMYIERFGFVGTGIEEEDRNGNLVEWVRIERSDALLKQLPSRTASHEQLRQWARTEAPFPLILTTLEGPANTMELGMLASLKRAKTQNQKYVLSRYLLEPLANGQERRTLVFDLPTLAASPSATKTQTSGGAKKRSTHPGSPAPHRDHYAE